MSRFTDSTPDHDAFWIVALWRALHGPDELLPDIAATVIANLSRFLLVRQESFGLVPPYSPALKCRVPQHDLYASNDDDDVEPVDALPDRDQLLPSLTLFCRDPREFSIDHYYFKSEGVFFRLDRPAFACLPTAA